MSFFLKQAANPSPAGHTVLGDKLPGAAALYHLESMESNTKYSTTLNSFAGRLRGYEMVLLGVGVT